MTKQTILGLGDTIADNSPPSSSASRPFGLTMRQTVLPRVAADATPVARETPRFEPMRLLGRGGIGEVTLALDNDIDRQVAVKRLRAEARSEEGLHRFVQEIRTVGQLEHPNIAPIHDVGIDDHGEHYFVMRYVEGETLDAIIAKLVAGDPEYHRRYTFEHRTQIFLGILHAIHYAHSKQILHRDIKPSNVMIGRFGEVSVMDWGLAKLVGKPELPIAPAPEGSAEDSMFRTRHGSLIGTPAYMSPEQANGDTDKIDERSDVYSLCVLFYELLALQHYLPGRGTLVDMLASIANDPHDAAHHAHHDQQPTVPAELAWFVEGGLAKDPAQRYPSVAAMIDSLQRLVAGGFEVKCYVTMLKRGGTAAVKFADRHPRVALIAPLLVIALAIVGVVTLIQRAV
jgi:serine/threonine-protein kinase